MCCSFLLLLSPARFHCRFFNIPQEEIDDASAMVLCQFRHSFGDEYLTTWLLWIFFRFLELVQARIKSSVCQRDPLNKQSQRPPLANQQQHRLIMQFSRIASFFSIFMTLGLFALASPVSFERRADNASIDSVLTTLQTTTTPILSQISELRAK